MKIIIATHNKHKLQEMSRILSPMGYEVVTDRDLGIELTDAEENGKTFLDNARIKAESGCKESGLPCIADDSGLCVDALDGAPGVFSARYSGVHGDDDGNNKKLLSELDGVPTEKRTAHFACAICVSFPDGSEVTATGKCEGYIGYEKKGTNGFGYDPLFMVGDRSLAEMTAEEKDAISHRGNALKELQKILPIV
ncbi:MAG: XTP/dITP diphosphatase [Clostridia bacterium]|nr:XTP/dITP diphosphatase [Clostridia bacterium]MBQ1995856.1 XTP/dITP diphosphatase [Clostridia bacterium]MBQ5905090.1 XTP/dITP diphosphatase [Clostridia bacterium]